MRALNASGTSWGTPVIAHNIGNNVMAQSISLAVVNGRPAISYNRTTWNDLKYIQASTATGGMAADWGAPVDLDWSGRVGEYSSLIAVNGNPAIAYFDRDNQNLKWTTYSAPASSPDIQVAQGGPLTDGVTEVDFGTVALGTDGMARTFTITNTGDGTLNLFFVSKGGIDTEDFDVGALSATIVEPAESATLTVTFLPGASGPKSATLQIISNVTGAKNSFDIPLSGKGATAQEAALAVIAEAGLTGDNALPNATPFNDGVENLLKYAFNMNLAGPDAGGLQSGTGTSGLPLINTPDDAPPGTLRFEFLRRKGSGLVYLPQKNTTLEGTGWFPLTAVPAIEFIDDEWERVVYTEELGPVPAPNSFGRVSVSLP
jgi:hypothetical protein